MHSISENPRTILDSKGGTLYHDWRTKPHSIDFLAIPMTSRAKKTKKTKRDSTSKKAQDSESPAKRFLAYGDPETELETKALARAQLLFQTAPDPLPKPEPKISTELIMSAKRLDEREWEDRMNAGKAGLSANSQTGDRFLFNLEEACRFISAATASTSFITIKDFPLVALLERVKEVIVMTACLVKATTRMANERLSKRDSSL